MSLGSIIGIWIGALLTLMIFSFLYKDNPVYKLAEHIFLGVSLGFGWCFAYWTNIFPQAIKPLFYPTENNPQDFVVLIPIVLGIFIVLRLIPKLSWLSRYSFAILIGGYAGLAIPIDFAGRFLPQIVSTMNPIWPVDGADSVGGIGPAITLGLKQLFLLVGVFSTVVFFFFSLEHKGVVGKISRIGVLFIMVSFGAAFGYTVMGRISLLIGRFQFLIYDWWDSAIMGLG